MSWLCLLFLMICHLMCGFLSLSLSIKSKKNFHRKISPRRREKKQDENVHLEKRRNTGNRQICLKKRNLKNKKEKKIIRLSVVLSVVDLNHDLQIWRQEENINDNNENTFNCLFTFWNSIVDLRLVRHHWLKVSKIFVLRLTERSPIPKAFFKRKWWLHRMNILFYRFLDRCDEDDDEGGGVCGPRSRRCGGDVRRWRFLSRLDRFLLGLEFL